MIFAVLGISVPSFILATILEYIFAFKLQMLPVARFDTFAHSILPAIAVATTPLAFIARLMRSSMLDVLYLVYIKTAKAKGLSGRVTIYCHVIRIVILHVIFYILPFFISVLF